MKSAKLSLATYVVAIVVPTLELLFLEFRSIGRQRQTVEELSAANLPLLCERLASEMESSVQAGMEECLHEITVNLAALPNPKSFADARLWRTRWEDLRKT